MKRLFTLLLILISFVSNGQKGTFIDTRDNKSYKWIKFGEQTWMGENLKYKDTTLYDYATITLDKKDTITGICPYGWHIPTVDEWNKLFFTLGKQTASEKLKDKNGFDLLFNGKYSAVNKVIEDKRTHAYFWTSNQRDLTTIWIFVFYEGIMMISKREGEMKDGYSLRCVKN